MGEWDEEIDCLREARDFAEGNTTTDYLLVHKKPEGPEIAALDFRGVVQNEMKKLVSNALTTFLDDIRDGRLSINGLSAINTVTEDSTLQHAHEADLPETALFRALTTDKDYPNTTYDKEDPPDFQLIKISDGQKTLIGVQNHQTLKTYNNSQSGLSLLYEDSVYTKFEGDLLIVPESLNAVYFDGHIFVRTPKSFEKMFNMRNEYESKAKNVLGALREAGIDFADNRVPKEWLLGDIRILRKMYQISENGIPEHATPDDFKEMIEKYPADVRYKMNGDTITLDIDEYHNVWALLRLLNADYAEAEIIPDARLEINSKKFIQD